MATKEFFPGIGKIPFEARTAEILWPSDIMMLRRWSLARR